VDVIVESGITLTVDDHIHDTSDFARELVESSVSSQFFRYSFVTPLIENGIDHETVDPTIVTSSELSLFPRADCRFMIVPTESSSSESSEFHAMI